MPSNCVQRQVENEQLCVCVFYLWIQGKLEMASSMAHSQNIGGVVKSYMQHVCVCVCVCVGGCYAHVWYVFIYMSMYECIVSVYACQCGMNVCGIYGMYVCMHGCMCECVCSSVWYACVWYVCYACVYICVCMDTCVCRCTCMYM